MAKEIGILPLLCMITFVTLWAEWVVQYIPLVYLPYGLLQLQLYQTQENK